MERISHRENKQDQSRKALAIVLIIIGLLWIFRKSGLYFDFPFYKLNHLFAPIGNVFNSLAHVVFSWLMILIFVGLVLMAGKRSGGTLLLLIGGLFLLPKIFIFTGAMIFLFLPLLLIAAGIAIIARLL